MRIGAFCIFTLHMKKLAGYFLLLGFIIPFLHASGQINPAPPVKIQYDLNSLLTDTLPPDTLTNYSQLYHPLYKQFPYWFELGNEGMPALPAKWIGLTKLNQPHYLVPLKAYASAPDKLEFYKTYGPYALLAYSSGGSEDINGQVIQTRFARNISPDLLVNVTLKFIKSPGLYANQSSTQSSFVINADYNKNRYAVRAGVETLSFNYGENGGLADANGWTASNPAYIEVNLNKGASTTNWTIFKGRQEFDLFGRKPLKIDQDSLPLPGATDSLFISDPEIIMDSISMAIEDPVTPDTLVSPEIPASDSTEGRSSDLKLFHSFYYQSSKRLYKDAQPVGSDFFTHYYFLDDGAQDSVNFLDLNNRFGITQSLYPGQGLKFYLQAGIQHELVNWRSNNFQTLYNQLAAFASLSGMIRQWSGTLDADFRFAGPGQGAYSVLFQIQKEQSDLPFQLKGQVGSTLDLPGISYMIFSGNHDRWLQSMKMQAEQFATLQAKHNPTGLEGQLSAHLISNWAYFDSLAVARQANYSTSLLSMQLKKVFKAGPFQSVNLVHFQYTPAPEIPLPLLIASSSNFMHHDINFPKTNGRLEIEYGIDLRYVTGYDGYAYQPSSGAFYLRNGTPLGNYPYLDIFLTLRVKRTRVFVKWEHFNGGFTGRGFFPVEGYPTKVQILKYGVYWHFYD